MCIDKLVEVIFFINFMCIDKLVEVIFFINFMCIDKLFLMAYQPLWAI